jgi:hypothetical protein
MTLLVGLLLVALMFCGLAFLLAVFVSAGRAFGQGWARGRETRQEQKARREGVRSARGKSPLRPSAKALLIIAGLVIVGIALSRNAAQNNRDHEAPSGPQSDVDKMMEQWKAEDEKWQPERENLSGATAANVTDADRAEYALKARQNTATDATPHSEQETHTPSIGEEGVLRGVKGAGSVPVFIDRKALDAYYEANARNDYEDTMKELFNAGKLYMVDAGTKVRVLDAPDFFGSTREIRILEGEFESRRGFVSSQWVTEK